MNVCKFVGVMLLIVGWANAALLQATAIRHDDAVQEVVMENEVLRATVTAAGGRISSLILKEQNREFCDGENQTFSGLGKIREVLFNNIETMTGRFALAIIDEGPEKLVVQAVYTAGTGNLTGMRITRTYTLQANAAALEGKVRVTCLERPANFQLNLHNLFPLAAGSAADVVYYLPTQRGLAAVGQVDAELQKMNLASDPAAPWCAFVDTRTAQGLAVQFDHLEQLEGMFVWAQNRSFTLEANFKDVELRPVAAADEWETGFRLLPLSGLRSLTQVSQAGAFAVTRGVDTVTLDFMAAVALKGSLSLWQGERKVVEGPVWQLSAGGCASLTWPVPAGTEGYTVRLQSDALDAAFALPAEGNGSTKIALDKALPKKEVSGVSGFYYYYPEVWLSAQTSVELSLGLRGDFKKHQNFRFAIDLPAGVELQYSRSDILQRSQVMHRGQAYQRVELASPRRVDYFSAMRLNLQLTADFREPALIVVQALWDNGAQTPQEIMVRQAPALAEIGEGLQYFKIGVESDGGPETWPDFKRIGINAIMVSTWGPPLILYGYMGKDYFAERISQLKERGLFPIYGAGAPYCNIDRVMQKLDPYYTGAGTLYHPVEKNTPLDLEAARAIDINGKPTHMPCPSFHGPLLEKAVDSLKSLIDYGFDHVCYDEEMWGNGNTLCFCPRCKTAFAEFLRVRYPALVYVDPAVATLDPTQHADVYAAWWDFKTEQIAEIYRVLRETLETYSPRPGVKRQMWVWVDCSVGEGRYGAITSRLTDYAKLGQHADLLLPMIYTPDAADVARVTVAGGKALGGAAGRIGAGLSPNRTYEYYRVIGNNLAPMDAIREQLLETFFNGGRIAVIWAYRSALRGAHDYSKIAETVRMLQPVEEILWHGQPVDSVLSSNPAIPVTAWEYRGKIAVLLRSRQSDAVRTRVTFPANVTRVVNTLNGKALALPDGLDVTLADDRIQVWLAE